jgi:hypothetical protein
MSIDLMKLVTPSSVKFDSVGSGGKPTVTKEDIYGAIGNIKQNDYASADGARSYSRAIINGYSSEIPELKRLMLSDLEAYWKDKHHPKYGEKYLEKMVNVAIMVALAGAGKQPTRNDKAIMVGCNVNAWDRHFKVPYQTKVDPLLRIYETMIDSALRGVHADFED